MKNILLKKVALISLIFTIGSCSTDWFTPIVDLQIPPHDSKLVVYANWQAGSDSLIVFVTKSRGSLDSSLYDVDSLVARQGGRGGVSFQPFNYDTVKNVEISLYKNDVLVSNIPSNGLGFYGINTKVKIDSLGGSIYKIKVTAPGFPDVEASQPSFKIPKVTNLTYKLDGAYYTNPSDIIATPKKGDEFGIEFQDENTEINYYDVLTAYFEYKDASGVLQRSRNFIPRNIDPSSDNEVLSDLNFNGKKYRWLLWARNRDYSQGGGRGGPGGGQNPNDFTPKSGDKLTMTFRTFNKDWNLFKKSRSLLTQSQDNIFFSEPVLLYTNIKNGYGIFFINAEKTVTITLP